MATTVRDVMAPDPVTVTPQDGVETVYRLMKEHELQGLPVVNEGGRCIGIVTEADLVIADEEGDLHIPYYIELFGGLVFLEPLRNFERKLRKAAAVTVAELMTEDPVTVDADASIRAAARRMTESHHNRLPVVEHGRLVGVLTRLDVLRGLAAEEA
ncbi:MAG TPA: CBS domain-containing protein [Baekduia sp.]|nr:CBS domain-containing protein [Baekduia sp.]